MAASKAKPANDPNTLHLREKPGQSEARKLADVALDPTAHALVTSRDFTKGTFGAQSLDEMYAITGEAIAAVKAGDLSRQRDMLAGQSMALNAIFTELCRRAALNMGDYIKPTEVYMRLALKAQAQCRSTIEALDRLTNGHVQTVKHVHVGEGGQAVIADEIHHHAGGKENGSSAEQPHATGTGAAGASAALPSPDPFGNGVPLPSREGEPAMQDARRQG